MKIKLFLLALVVGTQWAALAQETADPIVVKPSLSYTKEQLDRLVPRARPEDVSSPEAIVKALHEAVSGPKGDWNPERLRSLCVPNVFFENFGKNEDKTLNLSTWSLDKTIEGFRVLHKATSWYMQVSDLEVTIEKGKSADRAIAVVNYNGSDGPTPKEPVATGGKPTTTATLIFMNDRWYVLSHTWL